jgi:hypothetical protein
MGFINYRTNYRPEDHAFLFTSTELVPLGVHACTEMCWHMGAIRMAYGLIATEMTIMYVLMYQFPTLCPIPTT